MTNTAMDGPVEIKICETCAVVDVRVEMRVGLIGPVLCAVCSEMLKVTTDSKYFFELWQADQVLENERIAEKKRLLGD